MRVLWQESWISDVGLVKALNILLTSLAKSLVAIQMSRCCMRPESLTNIAVNDSELKLKMREILIFLFAANVKFITANAEDLSVFPDKSFQMITSSEYETKIVMTIFSNLVISVVCTGLTPRNSSLKSKGFVSLVVFWLSTRTYKI